MTVDQIISAAGGVGKLAKIAAVSHSSVCDWRRADQIPVQRALVIHEKLAIPLHEIRPDVWRAQPEPEPAPLPERKRGAAA